MKRIPSRKIFCALLVVLLSTVLVSSAAVKEVNAPDPLRFKNDINEFKKWDSKNSFPRNSVLFVGSSSIRMWKTRLSFPDYPVINRGFGGSHISDIIYYYPAVIKKYNPSIIVFYAGDNDIASGKPTEQVFSDYKQLIRKIKSDFPGVSLLYLPIKPTSSRWKYWSEMKNTNRLIRKFNRQNDKLFYVDTATALLQPDGTPDDSLFFKDKLHMNEKGYKIWSEILEPHLKKLYRKNTSGCGEK